MVQNVKKFNKSILCLGICLGLLFSVGLAGFAKADNASLYFSPNQGTFFVGSTFDVSVFVNTEGNSINAVQADLKFPPDLLQVTSPTTGSSFISTWTAQPFYSNKEGIINFKGGVLSPGINTSSGLVSTISFRVKHYGTAEISFLESCKVLLSDGKGTNILKTSPGAKYILVVPPSEGPKITSPTHPCLTCWYKNNNPSFYWEKEPGAVEFSYSLDQDPQGVSDNLSEGSQNSVVLNDVRNGISYFHLKAKKDNIYGGVSHYPIQIDTFPPKKFFINIERIGGITGLRFFSYFSTVDLLSGIDHYEISVVELSDPQAVANPFFMEVVSPYQIPFESHGKYAIVVRAYDKARNFTESKSVLTIVSPFISYTGKGVQIKNLLFPWWVIYCLLGVVLILLAFGTYRILSGKNLARKLKKEVVEAEKEIKDVRELEEKIQRMRVLEEKAGEESKRLAKRLINEEEPPAKF